MELMTSWEEKGFKIGFQQGFQEGLQDGVSELIVRQFKCRFGKSSKRTQANLKRLSFEQLQSLAEDLLDFTDAPNLAYWLREHANTNVKSTSTKQNQYRNPVRQAA